MLSKITPTGPITEKDVRCVPTEGIAEIGRLQSLVVVPDAAPSDAIQQLAGLCGVAIVPKATIATPTVNTACTRGRTLELRTVPQFFESWRLDTGYLKSAGRRLDRRLIDRGVTEGAKAPLAQRLPGSSRMQGPPMRSNKEGSNDANHSVGPTFTCNQSKGSKRVRMTRGPPSLTTRPPS